MSAPAGGGGSASSISLRRERLRSCSAVKVFQLGYSPGIGLLS
jgi:hypothetical protein